MAQSTYIVDYGRWSVMNAAEGRCIAISKPGIEYNMAPYMSFELSMAPDQRDVGVTVNFWPGAFEKGEAVTLDIGSGAGTLNLQATAISGHAVTTDSPVPWREMRALGSEFFMSAKASNLPEGIVGTLLQPSLGRLMGDLRNCQMAVKGG